MVYRLKEKRRPKVGVSLSGEEGGSVEHLVKFLELIKVINEEKRMKEKPNNPGDDIFPGKVGPDQFDLN